jgi:hypothetical protein
LQISLQAASSETFRYTLLYELLIYADYVNLLDENVNTTNKNTKALLDASKLVGLEVKAKKIHVSATELRTKCNTRTGNKFFETVA